MLIIPNFDNFSAMQGVFKSRTFVEMSEESLSYVLQSDKLKADESEVLNAVKEWSTVNAVSNCIKMNVLKSKLRFNKVSKHAFHLF